MAKEGYAVRQSGGKSIEDIQRQAQNLLRQTNSRSRAVRINAIQNRYVQNIASSNEYRNASNGVQRALMNGNAAEVNRYNEQLDRLNNRRVSRSTYMR